MAGDPPSSPPRLSRNRRSRGRGLRTTSGCTTCRKRHLKCDEVKPTCSQCKKAKKQCSYPQQSSSSAVSRAQQEERIERAPHENGHARCTPSQLHDNVHQQQFDGDCDDLTQTPSPHHRQPQYETPSVILSWGDDNENTGGDVLQQQSLDQLSAIVAADRDDSSNSSPLQHKSQFSAQNTTTHTLSASSSIASPGPTVNAATTRWFGLLAHDAARSTHGVSSVFDGTANSSIEDDNIRTIFTISDEENLDSSRLSPLQRATRIVDQQQPLGVGLGAEGEHNSVHLHLHPFEEQLWQSQRPIQLLPREYLLFEHFVRRVSQWIDLFDLTCKFASFVPHLAKRNAGLLNAILALSCRHISLNSSLALNPEIIANGDDRSYRDLALQYYYQTLHYVQKAMQYSSYKTSPELLATTLIISTYEMLNDSSKDWERHLEGVFLIQRSQVIHGESGGIKSAVWWAWLRQDIWAAFREKRKTWTFWTPKKPYANLTPFELAARSVYITAKVIDYCSQEAMSSMNLQARADQATHLRKTLDEWEHHLTVEFSPLPTMAHRDSSSVFSPIWICAPAFAVTIQVHCIGQILLWIHEPCMGGSSEFIKRQSAVKHCIEIICGISMTLNDDASSLMSSQCLYIAGMFAQDIHERNCILDLLDTRRKRTGWPVNPLSDELRQLWLANSLSATETGTMASSTPSHALFGLRDDTPQYEFEGPEHCSQILSRHYDLFDLSPVEQSQCIIISKVDRQAIDHYFGENGYGILALAGYNYLIKQQLLLIKTITRAHKNASFFFHQLLMDRLSEMGISRRNLYSFGAAGTTTDTRLKRPDDSYSPKGPPSRKWPTVVLEAGYVQSQGKLDQDARWWLQEFQGDVKIVLTISFWPDRRISTIQKWNLVDRPTANVPQRQVPEVVYGIDISQSAAKQPVQASHTEPLILPFADIFLRQPSEKDNQRDVLMSVEDLQELAEDVWEVQFDFPYDNDDGDDDDDAD